MGTLVCFHAHPDDESMATGGTIAKAVAAGHRVVVVYATGGEHGEAPDDLAPGETLVDRRRAEAERSAAVLGVARVAWLGYRDSGMTGWAQNSEPGAFTTADEDEAGGRLAAILREEEADVVTVYDWHGTYGHPDHIKVHVVGHRAAELAGTPEVYETTWSRDHFEQWAEAAREAGEEVGEPPTDDGVPFGMPESEITTFVDVSDYVARKRASITCHASQVTDSGFFLGMPDEVFAKLFATEWFIRKGAVPGTHETDLIGL